MADISVRCGHCGQETKISEHVDAAQVPCPSCGQPLAVPRTQEKPRLALRKDEVRPLLSKEPPPTPSTPHPALAGEVRTKPAGMDRVHISRDKVRTPRIMVAWVGLIGAGALLLGLQYGIDRYPFLRDYYIWVRNALFGLCYIVLLITAFEDNLFQGLFVLLVPPYAVYYVYVRSDSYMLRGVFSALLISIFAERFFLEQDALLLVMQDWVNRMIEKGSSLIDRAAEAPVY